MKIENRGAPWSGGSARARCPGGPCSNLAYSSSFSKSRKIGRSKDRVKSEIGKIARKADDDTDDQYGEA